MDELQATDEPRRQEAMQLDMYVPDCIYPSDNDLDIPTLRLDMQATEVQRPFVCFGEQARTFQMNGCGVLHFYTDDYRYNKIYDHPEQILHHNPAAIVEPNYSLFNETPMAFGLTNIYKKRTIARAMQDRGIKVLVDLNVSNKFYAANMLGVPRGWSAYCTRGYSDRLNYLEFEVDLARRWADGNRILFVVYGGGMKVKHICQQEGLIYVSPIVTIKNKAKAMERIKESICFFGTQISPKELMPDMPEPPSLEDLKERQVEDYTNDKLIG